MTQHAFYLDASACSGCKACQAACKDKNDLPVGVLWRRVYEVTGGAWTSTGETWTSDVFAYNLSLSCHHCAQPICVEVCPTQAMHKRGDGIVTVDQDKCVGCQYCAWACPHDAPQYDRARGQMTKCDFCADNLAAGLPPACVAACPMRVLEVRDAPDASQEVHPLPAASLTKPALIVKPHRAAVRPGLLGNAEEVNVPRGADHSLVAFTLLAQLAVGATWFQSVSEPFSGRVLALITGVMCIALLASLVHLGQPRHAWRAVANLGTSWLSREVLSAALFVVSLIVVLATGGSGRWLASATGLALLVSMARVYVLRTVPEWITSATTASFFVTTLLLGAVAHGALIGAGPAWAFGAIGLTGVRLLIGRHEPRTVQLLRAAAIVTLLVTLVAPTGWWVAFALTFAAELIARRQFYAMRLPRSAWQLATARSAFPAT